MPLRWTTTRWPYRHAQNPQDFRIVGTPLRAQAHRALMLRRNDAAFKRAVDAEISSSDPDELRAMCDKWFMSPIPPANVSLNLPFPHRFETAFSQPNSDPAEAYAMP